MQQRNMTSATADGLLHEMQYEPGVWFGHLMILLKYGASRHIWLSSWMRK
jgi:hypothetical protein